MFTTNLGVVPARDQPKITDASVQLDQAHSSEDIRGYPPFNPPHIQRHSRLEHENCLSYALNHNLENPSFFNLKKHEHDAKQKLLKYFADEINKHYADPELILIADHQANKLPNVKKDYYIIALVLSNTDNTLHQRLDYHFLVQNNDGYFSHRRYQAQAERRDAKGNLILNPENAFLTYPKDSTGHSYVYKFIGYFYVKLLEKRPLRNQPVSVVTRFSEFKPTETATSNEWRRIGDFKPQKYLDSSSALDRKITFNNTSKTAMIKTVTLIGYSTNRLRVRVTFVNIDMCNYFLNLCPSDLFSPQLMIDECDICFDPKFQNEFDLFIQLIQKFDPLDKENIAKLPQWLRFPFSEEDKTVTLSDYPDFDADFVTGTSWHSENCLTYALCTKRDKTNINQYLGLEKLSVSDTLQRVLLSLNSAYEDNQFALRVDNRPGAVPVFKQDYYVIGLLISEEKGFAQDRSTYQANDFYFIVQNNDGYFSHRRGQGRPPEFTDSDGNKIKQPERAKFYYVSKQLTRFDKVTSKDVPVCFDYEFIGYLYIKTTNKRRKDNLPMRSICMENEIEKLKNINKKTQELYAAFQRKFFIFPPLVQYFPDARDDIQKHHAVLQKEKRIHTSIIDISISIVPVSVFNQTKGNDINDDPLLKRVTPSCPYSSL